jgi:hypothetical protein
VTFRADDSTIQNWRFDDLQVASPGIFDPELLGIEVGGVVRDSLTGAALDSIEVRAAAANYLEGEAWALTNHAGYFSLTLRPTSRFKLTIIDARARARGILNEIGYFMARQDTLLNISVFPSR